MKLKFSVSEITQDLMLKPVAGSEHQILEDPEGEGYHRSLSKGYLRGIREYMEMSCGGRDKGDRRFLLLAPGAFVARQGYLVLRRALSGESGEGMEGNDDYADFYMRFCSPSKSGNMTEPTLVVSDRGTEVRQEILDPAIVFPFIKIAEKADKQKSGNLEKAESVLVEIEGEKDPDEVTEKILALDNPWVAVCMKPAGSYEYITKRLVFEGNYRVIRLESPSREDYLEYARDYLEYHHFTADSGALAAMLDDLQAYRGELMTERDIYLHLDRCFCRAVEQGIRDLSPEDIRVVYDGQELSAAEEWERVVGLENVKQVLLRRLAASRVMKDRRMKLHCNYIMEGPPGTGKSKMARLMAKRMGEAGVSNGRFVDASRTDIIGKYLGHTAANVRTLFQRAEGGVLFVDEASFLLGSDVYVREAVVEFVRYMELYPQTVVIFATYPKEGRELLMCDPGFRSRIYQILTFEPYSNGELYEILKVMAEDYGFSLGEGCQEELEGYLAGVRERKYFGNAREVRRLLETAVEEYGLRTDRERISENSGMLKREDIRGAAGYLLAAEREEKRGIGFSVKGGRDSACRSVSAG